MGEKFTLYVKSDWSTLSDVLLREIERNALMGDSVKLTTNVSQFGCCQIMLGNQSEAYIVYKFFMDCMQGGSTFSTKEWGTVTRFLALYSLFDGDIEGASCYYNQSLQTYQLLNEEEETMMLLEAGRWFYSLLGNKEKMTYIKDRLRNHSQISFFEVTVTRPSLFWKYVLYYSEERNSHPLMKQFHQLYRALTSGKQKLITEEVYSLMAKVNQYKHPIFKAWASYFAGQILQKDEYTEKANILFKTYHLTVVEDEKISIKEPVHKFSFTLFNEFTVQIGSNLPVSLNNWKRKKAEELLIYLLIQPHLQVTKDVLMDELYPDGDIEKTTKRLYVNINTINKMIKELTNHPYAIVSMKDGIVSINLDFIEQIDIQAYVKLYSVGRQLWYTNREEAVTLFNKARQLYSRHFADFLLYVTWLNQFRDSLKEKQYDLLQKLYSYYDDENTKEKLLQEMLDCDPLNEETITEIIYFLQDQGRLFEAVQFYKQKRKLLQLELGIDFELDVFK